MPRIRLKHRSLARALSESRISQNRWAQELGISRGHLSMLLSGRRIYPRPETRRKLMKGLGLPFEELFEAESRSTFNRPLPGKRATRMPALLGVAPSLGRLFRADDDRPGAGILGVMLGMAAAWGLFRFLGSLLFAVQPTDAATYLAAAAFITCASLAAGYIPARKATRLDPAATLKAE